MALGLDIAIASASPKRAGRSEDRAEIFRHEDAVIAVVADGAGGMRGAAPASDAVIDAIRERVAGEGFSAYEADGWKGLLVAVDASLARSMGGETTAVVVVIGTRGVVGVSVGDSEAWLVGETGIDRLTEHQSGKRLGSGAAAPVAFCRESWNGVLLIATDGLFKLVAPDRILACCTSESTPEQVARLLVDAPRSRSGRLLDDVALVVAAHARATPGVA